MTLSPKALLITAASIVGAATVLLTALPKVGRFVNLMAEADEIKKDVKQVQEANTKQDLTLERITTLLELQQAKQAPVKCMDVKTKKAVPCPP